MRSRAAVAWEAGKPLVIEEVEVAGPKIGEVLLKDIPVEQPTKLD